MMPEEQRSSGSKVDGTSSFREPPKPQQVALPFNKNGGNSSKQPPVGQNHGAYGSNLVVTAQEVKPPSAHGTESSEGNLAHDNGSEDLSIPVQETSPAGGYSPNTDEEDPANEESNSTDNKSYYKQYPQSVHEN